MGRWLLLIVVLAASAIGFMSQGATALPTDRPVYAAGSTKLLDIDPAQKSMVASAPARQAAAAEKRRQAAGLGMPLGHSRGGKASSFRVISISHHVLRRQPVRPPLLRLPRILPIRTVRIPILMFHHVSSVSPATNLNYGLTVTDQNFASQLAYLRRQGYHTVLLRQVFAAMYKGARLPQRPIVLTFDDGYRDNYTDALPLLRAYHDVGEFNIISAYVGISVGINSYMSWSQLKKLVADGMEIGSHTVDHQDLGTLTTDKVRFELRDSRNILQRELRVPVQFLAYPSGEPFDHGSPATQQRVLGLVPQYGYVGALLDGPLTSSEHDTRYPFQLWRIRVAGGEGLDTFAALLQS